MAYWEQQENPTTGRWGSEPEKHAEREELEGFENLS